MSNISSVSKFMNIRAVMAALGCKAVPAKVFAPASGWVAAAVKAADSYYAEVAPYLGYPRLPVADGEWVGYTTRSASLTIREHADGQTILTILGVSLSARNGRFENPKAAAASVRSMAEAIERHGEKSCGSWSASALNEALQAFLALHVELPHVREHLAPVHRGKIDAALAA